MGRCENPHCVAGMNRRGSKAVVEKREIPYLGHTALCPWCRDPEFNPHFKTDFEIQDENKRLVKELRKLLKQKEEK